MMILGDFKFVSILAWIFFIIHIFENVPFMFSLLNLVRNNVRSYLSITFDLSFILSRMSFYFIM